ncbi:MAG TPA: hypothetical protein VJM32_01435 [Candidatus Saccharimonadales bacterium]|nr:hypothetical protein [Candidatus Saccharimonadales bacterium]
MKALLLSLSVAAVLLAGCSGSEPEPAPTTTAGFVPQEQQNVLTRQTVAAGYGVAGIPYYESTRWLSNVRLQGCSTNITIAGPVAPEAAMPTSFTVLSIGGKPMAEISPGTDTTNMTAASLRAVPGVAERLGCTQ